MAQQEPQDSISLPPLAVQKITGRGGGSAYKAFVGALEGKVETSDGDQFTIGKSETDPAQAKALAAALVKADVLGVVGGSVRGRRARTRTSIKLFGRDGQLLLARRIRGNIYLSSTQKKVAKAATEMLEKAKAAYVPPQRTKIQSKNDESSAKSRPEPKDNVELPSSPALVPTFVVLAGIQARSRIAHFNQEGVNPHYESGLYPEVTARLELHPLAATAGSKWYAGLFLKGEFALSIGLKTRIDASGDDDASQDTKSWRIRASGGFLFPALDGNLRIGATFDYQFDSFEIENNNFLASSEYQSIGGSLGAIYQIDGPALGIDLFAGYGAVLEAGAIGNPDADFSVGAFSGGHLVHADVGIRSEISVFALRAHASMSNLWLDFEKSSGTNVTATDFAFTFGGSIGVAIR